MTYGVLGNCLKIFIGHSMQLPQKQRDYFIERNLFACRLDADGLDTGGLYAGILDFHTAEELLNDLSHLFVQFLKTLIHAISLEEYDDIPL